MIRLSLAAAVCVMWAAWQDWRIASRYAGQVYG